ncbi:adenosylhomocysteinase-like [Neltuma alba]|uniref:adenosylhomocysteinase-like n=1 Tax=Neltuma alba TaxID=207710 RepID=UPI0010A4BE89|nr:adenosylhomocysteinase-like [Prosopis alba]
MAGVVQASPWDHYSKVEMPGLRSCLAEFGPSQPFRGARIVGHPLMTSETIPFEKILTDLGAEVRCLALNTCFIMDRIAATWEPWLDIDKFRANLEDRMKARWETNYWQDIKCALDWGPSGGPNLIVGAGGDATFLINEGVKAEEIYAKTGQFPDPSSTDDPDLHAVRTVIRNGMEIDPMWYHKMKDGLVGVSEETAMGGKRLYQMQADGSLLFPAINVNDSVTKSKFINLYGCRSALLDGIKRGTNMTIPGKKAVVFGYEDASKGCAIALKQAGADVVVYTVDSNHTVQAGLGGFKVIKALDDVVPEADIFVTPSINKGNILIANYMKKMKNNAIIYSMDPIVDLNSNSMYAGLEQYLSGMKRIIVNPQTDKWVFPDTNSSILMLSNTGYPDLMSSWSCTSRVVAALELWSNRGTGKYENKVYDFPEPLEEKVSALHFAKHTTDSVMTKTTEKIEGRADHVSLRMEGPRNILATNTEPTGSDKVKRMLLMAARACLFFGTIGFGVMTVPKVNVSLPFPKICIDLAAIWGN